MRYTVVINACVGVPVAKAQELNGFLFGCGLPREAGHTILLYRDEAARPALLALVPTAEVSLVRLTRYQPENVLAVLQEMAAGLQSDLYLFTDDLAGRELSVRLACRLSGESLTSVRSLAPDADGLRCRRAVYASHIEATFALRRGPFCLSVAKGCAEPLPIAGRAPRIVLELDRRDAVPAGWTESRADVAPARLEAAAFILAVGRGAQSAARTARLAAVADRIGAEFAASRPVVMNAWAPLNRLVGVSGVITRPRLCIVAGASGSAAFLAGIEKSRFIVAVNVDERAPILKCCDVGVVGDCVAVLEQLATIMQVEHDAAEGGA